MSLWPCINFSSFATTHVHKSMRFNVINVEIKQGECWPSFDKFRHILPLVHYSRFIWIEFDWLLVLTRRPQCIFSIFYTHSNDVIAVYSGFFSIMTSFGLWFVYGIWLINVYTLDKRLIYIKIIDTSTFLHILRNGLYLKTFLEVPMWKWKTIFGARNLG